MARRTSPGNPRTPLQRAVGLLARREHSAHELQRKLVQAGAAADEAADALQRLQSSGLQDELRFAASLLRQRQMAGYGPLYLRAELASQHRLSSALIEQVFADAAVDWCGVASDLLARRFSAEQLGQLDSQRRAMALLQRRGFDGDCARLALRRAAGYASD